MLAWSVYSALNSLELMSPEPSLAAMVPAVDAEVIEYPLIAAAEATDSVDGLTHEGMPPAPPEASSQFTVPAPVIAIPVALE